MYWYDVLQFPLSFYPVIYVVVPHIPIFEVAVKVECQILYLTVAFWLAESRTTTVNGF